MLRPEGSQSRESNRKTATKQPNNGSETSFASYYQDYLSRKQHNLRGGSLLLPFGLSSRLFLTRAKRKYFSTEDFEGKNCFSLVLLDWELGGSYEITVPT